MGVLCLFSCYRRQIHREQHAGFGKFTHANDRPRGAVVSHFTNVGAVHFFEVAHVLEKNVDVDDVIQIGVDRLKHDLERVENLRGLRENVISCELTSGGIHACCPADGDERTDFGDVVVGTNGSGGIGRRGSFDF